MIKTFKKEFLVLLLLATLVNTTGCSVQQLRQKLRTTGESLIVTVYDSTVVNKEALGSFAEINLVPKFDAVAFGRFIALHGHKNLPDCNDSGVVRIKSDKGDAVQVVNFSLTDRCVAFEISRKDGKIKRVKKRLKKRAISELDLVSEK